MSGRQAVHVVQLRVVKGMPGAEHIFQRPGGGPDTPDGRRSFKRNPKHQGGVAIKELFESFAIHCRIEWFDSCSVAVAVQSERFERKRLSIRFGSGFPGLAGCRRHAETQNGETVGGQFDLGTDGAFPVNQ
ncbi:hypothetical protein SDC9_167612 [bioreactor metagenome]|uniref:Uncharacterized protein n=1 Tax=bioreactor metagenome TaxID=1076179 RepID=A0A645G7Z7_9ZZZZ